MQTNIELLFCRLCKTDTPVSDFTPFQQTAPYPRCKACVNKKSKDWYDRNPERRKQTARKWALANPKKVAAKSAAWRAANPERAKAATKRSAIGFKDRVFDHYGRVCVCCGESISRFLAIDHINNDGNKHRKEVVNSGTSFYSWLVKHNFPPEFQVLCHNCNFGKHLNGGVCPHKDPLMKHPDQEHADEIHEIHHPVGHGFLDTRRDLHNRSPHAMNTPIIGQTQQPTMDPSQSY